MNWKDVITFWFKECKPQQWFAKSTSFDRKIKKRFEQLYWQGVKGEMADWRKTPKGRLAEILILDQFSRNMFREKAQSFAADPLALALAQEAIRAGAEKKLNPKERWFLYLPFMHAESKKMQKESVRLFRALGNKQAIPYAIDHRRIIDRFGRFPHRNSILRRKSTAAEKKFMRTHKGF